MAARNNRMPLAEDSNMTLRSVCERSEEILPYFKSGLGALENKDKAKIKVPSTSLLGGSVNLDEAAKAVYPKENRWDYALEYDGNTFILTFKDTANLTIATLAKVAHSHLRLSFLNAVFALNDNMRSGLS